MAYESNVYREQLADKALEIQQLKREIFDQELQLRNELTDDFESYCAQREATFQTRLKQAREAAVLPYKLQVSNSNELQYSAEIILLLTHVGRYDCRTSLRNVASYIPTNLEAKNYL